MLCKKCGAELEDDAVKCEYCGKAVEQNEETKADKIQAEKEKELSKIQERRDSKKAKKRRNKVFLVIAICVAAAMVAYSVVSYIGEFVEGTGSAVVSPTPSVTLAPKVSATPAVTVAPSPTAAVETPTPAPEVKEEEKADSWTATDSSSTAEKNNNTSTAPATNSSSTSQQNWTPTGNTGSSNSTSTATSSVNKSSDLIMSKQAVGGEVVNSNGKWYMTFTSGGKKYYANVNPGATTEQVKGVEYTISAMPTSDSYNGNTVYEIFSMKKESTGNITESKYASSDAFVIDDSDVRYLSADELKGLSKADLALARNEIYARKGRKFKTTAYQQYFESKSWYHVNPNYNYNDDNANLSEVEKKNVEVIMDVEN